MLKQNYNTYVFNPFRPINYDRLFNQWFDNKL